MTDPTNLQAPSVVRANYRRAIANGVLFSLGENLSSAGLVLTLLVRQLGGSLTLVGLLPALQAGGYLLPQLIVGGRVQSMARKMPLYRNSAIVRVSAFALLTAAVFAAGMLPPALSLALIVGLFTVFTVSGGTSSLAFQDIIAKTIPPRRRGALFATRQLFGGLAAFAIAGPLVAWLLDDASPLNFPFNFGVLCLFGLIGISAGLLVFVLIDEPAQAQPGPRLRVIDGLRAAPDHLRRNHGYRWFIISRFVTRAGQVAEPFYIVYATEALGLRPGVAGTFLAVRALTGALSNVLWSRMSQRRGNRRVLVVSGVLITTAPMLMLLLHFVAPQIDSDVALEILFGLVFVLVGAATDGSNVGGVYLMDIVPANERPTYLGFANTTLGLATLLPILGGWLLYVVGYPGTFAISVCFAVLGLFATMQLREGRGETQSKG